MNITNRNKMISIQKENNDGVPIVLDIRTLDTMCKYVLSDSTYIRKHHLMNLKKFIEIIDPNTYNNDVEKVDRFNFIKKALEARLDRRILNSSIVIDYIITSLGMDISFMDLNDFQLSIDELEWINETITESLNYAFIYRDIDTFQDICTRFKGTDYRYRGPIVKEFEALVDNTKSNFRLSKVESLTDMTFSLQPGKFEETVETTYNTVTNPSRRLITGMQGFNGLINGGFESGRVYMFFGMTGGGKSMTLLDLVYQMKKYNRHYKPKDPTKTPAIVILTMENTVIETITRLFEIATCAGPMENYTLEQVLYKLRNEGELYLNDDSPIDIIIKYKANKSVDTGYLYNLVDDLEDQGYETICLVQDHVKRIRSIYKQSDIRIELGEVVNEFKVFAGERDIPVITDSHLNRDAAKVVEASINRQDSTKLLGKSSVGESMLMLDNLDMGIILNKDYDTDGSMYMAFSTIKTRVNTERLYMLQPFVQGSGIRLVEDLDSPIPLFKEQLHTPNNLVKETRSNVKRSTYSDIDSLNGMFDNNPKDNIFERATAYTCGFIGDEEEEEVPYDGSMIPECIGAPSQPIPFQKPLIVPIYFYKEDIQVTKKSPIYFMDEKMA